jgi:hypothetical protein
VRISANAPVLGDHIGVLHQLAEELEAGRRLQIEGDPELVAIAVLGRRHPFLDAVAAALHAE